MTTHRKEEMKVTERKKEINRRISQPIVTNAIRHTGTNRIQLLLILHRDAWEKIHIPRRVASCISRGNISAALPCLGFMPHG